MTPQSPLPSAPLGRIRPRPSRLHLRPDPSGYIDAAWWPRSSNLAAELLDLIPVLQPRTGPIRRIVYDPRAWSPAERSFIVGDRAVRLDPYPFELFGTMYLCGVDDTVLVVQAIPSGADAAFARSTLAATGSLPDPLQDRGDCHER